MSNANDLLNSLTESDISAYTVDANTEEHIVVDERRSVIVPASLRRIAAQYDHAVETVTFDCIRYWDGNDFSTMDVYIRFTLPNRDTRQDSVTNLTIDETNSNIIHFDWSFDIDKTVDPGDISFQVVIKKEGANGSLLKQWLSDINEEMYISDSLDIEGATGSFIDTADGTATSADIRYGQTAYVDGREVVGEIEDYDGSFTGGENGGMVHPNIPTFDLSALGMSTVVLDGPRVSFATNTSAIISAIGEGAVKISLKLNIGEEIYISFTYDPAYVPSMNAYDGVNVNRYNNEIVMTDIQIDGNGIYVSSETLNGFIGAYIDTALGGDY